MTVETRYKGEQFLVHADVLMHTVDLISKKTLTPLRVAKIRHSIENCWVNTHIKYGNGLHDCFTDQMCEYYIHKAFEAQFNTTLN